MNATKLKARLEVEALEDRSVPAGVYKSTLTVTPLQPHKPAYQNVLAQAMNTPVKPPSFSQTFNGSYMNENTTTISRASPATTKPQPSSSANTGWGWSATFPVSPSMSASYSSSNGWSVGLTKSPYDFSDNSLTFNKTFGPSVPTPFGSFSYGGVVSAQISPKTTTAGAGFGVEVFGKPANIQVNYAIPNSYFRSTYNWFTNGLNNNLNTFLGPLNSYPTVPSTSYFGYGW